ncbi:MAG TPA: hypothetical protein DCG04_10335, partial [Rhodospirillaceae bacterium]|nr:hypothetical protein [Rhodospirillaceae bacterium]
FGLASPFELMLLALAAYATYVINAAQFIWKLRAARLQHARLRAQTTESGSESNKAFPDQLRIAL